MRRRFRQGLQRALEFAVLGLTTALAVVVVLGVVFRKLGAALVWYDEVASILLAWLTFYGAALAALHRAHIGFPKLVDGLGPAYRRPLILLGEAFVLAFFLVTAWAGWRVFGILGGETLVSLPWVPQRLTQSVIPIGAVLFIIAELVSLPDVWAGPASHDDGVDPSEGEGVGLEGSA
ncbi:MAG TPA: TRAP transporter small permease subunit [Gemmatimonadetes bacterium]|jgi:TRAP-type C4-dicarboxylate transport system permease small subunit|nr:TRAP transporter small permease subunit [Gemmatimonadota bacterium]